MKKKTKIITSSIIIGIIIIAALITILLIGCNKKENKYFTMETEYNMVETKDDMYISPKVYTNDLETEIVELSNIEKSFISSKDLKEKEDITIREISTDIKSDAMPRNPNLIINGEQYYEIKYIITPPQKDNDYSLSNVWLHLETKNKKYDFFLGSISIIYAEDNLKDWLLLTKSSNKKDYTISEKDVLANGTTLWYKEIGGEVEPQLNASYIENKLIEINHKDKDKKLNIIDSKIKSIDKVYTKLVNGVPYELDYTYENDILSFYFAKKDTILCEHVGIVIAFTLDAHFTDGTRSEINLTSKTIPLVSTIYPTHPLTSSIKDIIKIANIKQK